MFGAHRSYSVLTGTSGSNRAIIGAIVPENRFAICDRNCHKSIEQGLVLSGGIPLFLVPTRNRYGIIGPIRPDQLAPKAIRARLESHPLKARVKDPKPTYAVVTNCTYDGVCYDARHAQDLLEKSVDVIHFDEAWYGYARFNPLYRDRHAMRGDPAQHPADGPTVFATHSTHKLLAALSQTSWIHVREGRRPVEPSIFNESYMAQMTTSPLYALIASNEIAAAMMEGPAGPALTGEVIEEAIRFRQALARAHREFARRGEWFFWPWNPPEVDDGEGGRVAFADADPARLATDPGIWTFRPGEAWHGFGDIPDGWCMLDPIKAGIVCPGMGDDGEMLEQGIPAAMLSSYLYQHGIVPSRTTDFMVLCLFSLGITKGKWGTAERGDWFFWPWNAPEVDDGKGGRVAFADADPERLATDPALWTFRPGEAWHGFGDIPDGWCMLDPIKVGIVCPGMGDDGEMLEQGIPAAMLSSYLYRHGIIPSRTTDFMVLCLFSMGVTKGKWGTLISALLDFKKDYDANRALAECLPDLVATAPGKYGQMGLKDLSDLMFQQMRSAGLDKWQAAAFGSLPHPAMPPRQASGLLNEGCAELLPLDRLADRVAGVGIIPYPPGIPIVMPGESFGPGDGPWLSYMRSLQDWGVAFPGFEKEVEGAVVEGGAYHVWCLKDT